MSGKNILEIIQEKCSEGLSECKISLFSALNNALNAEPDCDYGCTINGIEIPSDDDLKKIYLFLHNKSEYLYEYNEIQCTYLNECINEKGYEYIIDDERRDYMRSWNNDIKTIFDNLINEDECIHKCCQFKSTIAIPTYLSIPRPLENTGKSISGPNPLVEYDTQITNPPESHAYTSVLLPITKVTPIAFLTLITVVFIIFFSSKYSRVNTFLCNKYNWMSIIRKYTTNRNPIACNEDFLLNSTNYYINICYLS
ncbi:variable surface protein [Plasmodium gonderi]|uniref:Variable surface protein n=1 Tax=Plasmodium gonderi TaxID=77519 RepID=A0A1Y1JU45_PLAGO|nr:variable surface protein [Plasmodium gonderi]GAW83923.1 variable surface protein [Plasmodium gonderi]